MADAIDLQTLQSAFAAHEFFLVYQPIVALRDRSCFGAESLIRWRRGNRVLEASEFMPVTDRTPLSGLITYWVMDTVASELGDWLGSHENARIAINIPPEVLGRGGLEYAARKSGLRAHAHQLILEITERGVPDQLGLDALNSIPKTGASVALDDTTLSGANLALLTRCHFDLVKIDKTLIAQITADESPPGWMGGLAALLRTTSLQIIAEGVETEYQAGALQAAGVQMAQGHFFGPPLSAADFKTHYSTTK